MSTKIALILIEYNSYFSHYNECIFFENAFIILFYQSTIIPISTSIPNMSKATPKIRLVTISAIGKPTKTNSRMIPDIIKYILIPKIKSNNIKANTIKLYSYFGLISTPPVRVLVVLPSDLYSSGAFLMFFCRIGITSFSRHSTT